MFKSKHSVIFLSAMMCASIAWATNNGNNNDTTNIYNQPGAHATGGQGGAGGSSNASSTGVGVGVGIGGGANVDTNIKNTINTNIDASTRSNATSAVVGSGNSASKSTSNATGGKASAEGGSVGDIAIDASTRYERQVPSAYSNLAAPSAPCMGSSSIGASSAVFSVSAGTTWTSVKCDDREDIRVAYNYGDKEVAEQMLVNKIAGYAEAKQQVADRKAQAAVGK